MPLIQACNQCKKQEIHTTIYRIALASENEKNRCRKVPFYPHEQINISGNEKWNKDKQELKYVVNVKNSFYFFALIHLGCNYESFQNYPPK